MKIIEEYMEQHTKEDITFNKAVNSIIEAHTKVLGSKQLQQSLSNIENKLDNYIANRKEYIIKEY